MEEIKENIHIEQKKEKFLKYCVGINLFLNLLLLFYFKYFEFVISNINRIAGIKGFMISIPTCDIILPVGISFYIFQALGYSIDVYRGEIRAEKNFFRYALFVSFFPQLVAGPIERSKNLLNQIDKPTYFDVGHTRMGLLTMAYGLFMKVVVADQLANIIDPIYSSWNNQSGMKLMTATVMFAFQIYCDFEGYSQLAIGSAEVLGFHINPNFNTPYLCTSIKDFWKRWHISLTGWFRDYLYIPLGGNRVGKRRKYVNILIVFLVSGLWHGASWHFVAWGGINGIYNILQDVTEPYRQKMYQILRINTQKFLWKITCGWITFFFIDISWIFFRASGVRQAIDMLKRIWSEMNIWFFFSDEFYNIFGSGKNIIMVLFPVMAIIIIDVFRRIEFDLKRYLLNQQIVYRWLFYFAIILVIILWGAYGSDYEQTQFIYFQF